MLYRMIRSGPYHMLLVTDVLNDHAEEAEEEVDEIAALAEEIEDLKEVAVEIEARKTELASLKKQARFDACSAQLGLQQPWCPRPAIELQCSKQVTTF
jgi:hypothetical protein